MNFHNENVVSSDSSDIYSKEKRSELMSKVKSRDTKPELLVRSWLHRKGFRFRLHRDDLPGRPDLVLPKYKTAIFVHGCFWHQHPGCKKATIPKNNRAFWRKKLTRNIERDKENIQELENQGWKVIIIWECAIKNDLDSLMKAVQAELLENY